MYKGAYVFFYVNAWQNLDALYLFFFEFCDYGVGREERKPLTNFNVDIIFNCKQWRIIYFFKIKQLYLYTTGVSLLLKFLVYLFIGMWGKIRAPCTYCFSSCVWYGIGCKEKKPLKYFTGDVATPKKSQLAVKAECRKMSHSLSRNFCRAKKKQFVFCKYEFFSLNFDLEILNSGVAFIVWK